MIISTYFSLLKTKRVIQSQQIDWIDYTEKMLYKNKLFAKDVFYTCKILQAALKFDAL